MRLRFCSIENNERVFQKSKMRCATSTSFRSQLVKVPQNSENRRAYCCDAREEEEEEEEEGRIFSPTTPTKQQKKDIEEEEKITHTKKYNPFF